MKKWSHNGLMNDLAEYLGNNVDRIIWTDMQLGPSGSPRPDVYTIPKSYSNFRPLAYEIKVSVADFRADTTKGKWQSYLKYASGVIFAVPQGLINKDDVPKGCGLIVRYESGWRMAKGPTLTPIKNDLPTDFWIKLVIDGVDRSKRTELKHQLNTWKVNDEICKKYGQELAVVLADHERAADILQTKTAHIQSEIGELEVCRHIEICRSDRDELKKLRSELCDVLGISHNVTVWGLQKALKEKIKMLDADYAVKQMKEALTQALKSLERTTNDIKNVNGEVLE